MTSATTKSEGISVFPGVALSLKTREVEHGEKVKPPSAWDLRVGQEWRYVGTSLTEDASQLPLIVEHELSERGYTSSNPTVSALVETMVRGGEVLGASRRYLAANDGLALGDLIALDPGTTQALFENKRSLLVVLPLYGRHQHLVIERVQNALGLGGTTLRSLSAIICTRRRISPSRYAVEIELGKHFVDERALAFVAPYSRAALNKLLAINPPELAEKINEQRLYRRIAKGLSVVPHRRLRFSSPLIVEVGKGQDFLALDAAANGSLLSLDPKLTLREESVQLPAQIVARIENYVI